MRGNIAKRAFYIFVLFGDVAAFYILAGNKLETICGAYKKLIAEKRGDGLLVIILAGDVIGRKEWQKHLQHECHQG